MSTNWIIGGLLAIVVLVGGGYWLSMSSDSKKAMNDTRRKNLSLALKGVRLGTKGDTKAVALAYQAIDKAMKRGLIHKINSSDKRDK